MPVAISQDQTLPSRACGAGEGSCGRKPTTSPTCNGRACGSRPRCLPGSRRRASAAYLKSLAAATVLSVPHLILPATPAGAACETSERIDYRRAELPTARALALPVTSGGLRIDPCPSRGAGALAARADIPGGRWGEWSSGRFAQPAGDGSAWTGSRELTGRSLVLVSSFLSTARGPATPGVRSLALDWGSAASMRVAVEHGGRGDRLVGPFGAECGRSRPLAPVVPSYGIGEGGIGEGGSSAGYRYALGDSLRGAPPSLRVALTERLPVQGALGYPSDRLAPAECNGDGSGGPLRPRRTATGVSPPMPDPNGGAGTRGEPGAALGFGPHRPRDPGEASLAHLHAYLGNRIDWNGHGRVALSGLCFESEGRGPC